MLKVINLKKYFPGKSNFLRKTIGNVKAVDDVSFEIKSGETFGLVGESGCGKTTTGRTILRLLEPTDGEVYFDDKNLFDLNSKEMRNMRKNIQAVFQDPRSSLNPRMTVEKIINDPLLIHDMYEGGRKERIKYLLEQVGLSENCIDRYPHEFSGGQRQRIGIAKALAVNPKLVIFDEPVSALDVSVQGQVLNLILDLQEEFDLTYLFIAHDLGVVEFISDKIGVMYLGKIVEVAEKEELFRNHMHPYTKALLSAIPIPDPENQPKRIILDGSVPSPKNPPTGCSFNTRCPEVMNICKEIEPEFLRVGKNHFASCHLVKQRTK